MIIFSHKIKNDLDIIDKQLKETSKNLEFLEEQHKEINEQIQIIEERLEKIEDNIELKEEQTSKTFHKSIQEYQTMKEILTNAQTRLTNEMDNYNDTNITIGSFVNLVSDNETIYSDIYMQDGTTAVYYGTTEARIIQEIILKKDEIIANVDNMDDYNMLTELGYQTIGYTLINQYSLNEDGNITPEFRCSKESIKKIKL